MKKNILTLGFVLAMSALSFGQTHDAATRPKDTKTPAGTSNSDGTAQPTKTQDEKQREDVQRAETPANPNGGVLIGTPDPRVESPNTPAPAAQPASRKPMDVPAGERAQPAQPAQPSQPRQGTPATDPRPADKATTAPADRKGTPATDTRPADKASTQPADRQGTPQPATQPKKKTTSKSQKSEGSR